MNASRRRSTSLLCTLLARVGLAVAACGGGEDSAAVNAPPASPHTAAEKAATLNWLDKTNQMWTAGDFAALNQVTTGEMRTIHQVEEQQATSADTSRQPFQLTGLSITIPCQAGGDAIFVAYGDTDVFTLGQGLQPYAMVFQRTGGSWKLATAVQYPQRRRRLAGAVQPGSRHNRARRARTGSLRGCPGPGADPRHDRRPADDRDGITLHGQRIPVGLRLGQRPSGHLDPPGPAIRGQLRRALHPRPGPHVRAAAGHRARLLVDRLSHPGH